MPPAEKSGKKIAAMEEFDGELGLRDWAELDRVAALCRRAARMLKESVGATVMTDPLGGNATGEELAVLLDEAGAWLETAE